MIPLKKLFVLIPSLFLFGEQVIVLFVQRPPCVPTMEGVHIDSSPAVWVSPSRSLQDVKVAGASVVPGYVPSPPASTPSIHR